MGRLLLIGLLLVAGCSAAPEPGTSNGPVFRGTVAEGSTVDRIRKRGVLKIGGSQDAPLLSQLDPTTGKLTGFDAELGRLLAQYVLGSPKTELVTATSETREPLLSNGTVDVILQTYTITPARRERVAFAGPYYQSGQAIAVRKGTNGIAKPGDLAGKTVIAGANTPSIAAIRQVAPTAEIVEFGSDPECLAALKQGRGEAYVQDQALLVADASKDAELQLVGEPFTVDPYGIGIKHGDEEFTRFVNDWLREIQKSGLWQETWKKTIGTVVRGEAPAPPAITP
ncbi:glutamate ABC transporter substrate-binding protein [Lentzea sp. NPDC005914]|uniref:glutamate ABC transporter substrate-binding protein n=1 Tax=Lentzea sp. NPDC005914 TaxID=3154572 RepID=UPI003400C543